MSRQCLHCHRLATVGDRCVFCATAYKVGVEEGRRQSAELVEGEQRKGAHARHLLQKCIEVLGPTQKLPDVAAS